MQWAANEPPIFFAIFCLACFWGPVWDSGWVPVSSGVTARRMSWRALGAVGVVEVSDQC